MRTVDKREEERLLVQEALDLAKQTDERNRLGQFATPPALAADVVAEAAKHLSSDVRRDSVRFLDPALGTGAFWSMLQSISPQFARRGIGYEIDQSFANASRRLWTGSGLRVRCEDFTQAEPPKRARDRFDLVVCNPPYVRHHHIPADRKDHLRNRSGAAAGIHLSGLAGLYCHFLALAHPWMRREAIAAWLIPSEFMDVNYGGPLKQYLLERVTLLRVHQFDPADVQFNDALVSSAVVIFRNTPSPSEHRIEFTRGGSLQTPRDRVRLDVSRVKSQHRWTQYVRGLASGNLEGTTNGLRLGDIFAVKRGLVTGGNDFFVLSEQQASANRLPGEVLTPILPSPRNLKASEVHARTDGCPDLPDRRYLLDCRLDETELEARLPAVWAYLSSAPESLRNRYICRHRSPWFRQEIRPPAPLLCTYLGRGRNGGSPFRFILNHSNATAANVYHLLYPRPQLQSVLEERPQLLRQIWEYLNSVDPEVLLSESRVYGGGLHKLEPKELAQVSLAGIGADITKAILGGGVPQYPPTELGTTHQLLETVQLHP